MIKIYNLLNTIFTEECINCRASGKTICDKCITKLKNKHQFNKKNSELNFKNTNYIESVSWVKSPLSYENELVKKAIFRLKYSYTRSIAKYLTTVIFYDFFNFIKQNLKKTNKNLEDLILVPIPISKKRLIERDYNQSEILLKEILKNSEKYEKVMLKIFGKEYTFEKSLINILSRQKHTVKFAKTHSKEDRYELIKDAFSLNKEYENLSLENKVIILFDDITTTGATFYEARSALINLGADKNNIFAYAIAH